MANALCRTLQELDAQIAALSALSTDTSSPSSGFEELPAYTDDLLQTRRQSQIKPFPLPSAYDPNKHTKARSDPENFSFPTQKSPPNMANNMKCWQTLSKTNREIPPELSQQTTADYATYLLNCISASEKNTAKQFAEQYSKLKLYLTFHSRKDSFEEVIRSEIYSFLQTEFDDLDHTNLIQYQVKDYAAARESEAVVNQLLQNGYFQIRCKLHHAFRMLLHINVINILGVPPYLLLPERVNTYIASSQFALFQLAELFPDQPLIGRSHIPDISEALALQQKTSVLHLGCKAVTEEQFCGFVNAVQDGIPATALAATASLLRFQCEIVACLLAEDLIRDVVTEHKTVLTALQKHKLP